MVVAQVTAGVIISPPFSTWSRRIGLVRTERARRFAELPELTITACLEPLYWAKASSNFLTLAPIVTHVESRLSTTSSTSSVPYVGTVRGIRVLPGTNSILLSWKCFRMWGLIRSSVWYMDYLRIPQV